MTSPLENERKQVSHYKNDWRQVQVISERLTGAIYLVMTLSLGKE